MIKNWNYYIELYYYKKGLIVHKKENPKFWNENQITWNLKSLAMIYFFKKNYVDIISIHLPLISFRDSLYFLKMFDVQNLIVIVEWVWVWIRSWFGRSKMHKFSSRQKIPTRLGTDKETKKKKFPSHFFQLLTS